MACFRHVQTTSDRPTARCAGAGNCLHCHLGRGVATVSGRAAAGPPRSHPRTNGRGLGRVPRHRAAPASGFSPGKDAALQAASDSGWPAPCATHSGGRAGLPPALAGAGGKRGRRGRFPAAGRLGATARARRQALGDLPAVGPPRLAQSGSGYPPSQEQTRGPGGLEKNSPKNWQPC